jgi:hypothetical protein
MQRHPVLSLIVASLASTASAEPPPNDGWGAVGESKAYCEYVTALTDADRALLLSPELFTLTSTIATEETGAQALGNGVGLRQSVGLRVRTSRLRRGRALRKRTEAECERYRARAQLARILEQAPDVGLREGLRAEMRALEAALFVADSRVADVRTQVGARTSTQQELLAAQLKLEQLRNRLRGVRRQRDALPTVPDGLPGEITQLVNDFRQADERYAAADASVRESSAWDLDLRGGYDQIIGDSRDIPAFATVSFSISLGSLTQKSAHDRGLRKRNEWRSREFGGLRRGVADLLQGLEATRRHAQLRLDQVRGLRNELAERLAAIESLTGEFARHHRDALWFEWVTAGAEAAHLEARLPRLDAFLVAAAGTSMPAVAAGADQPSRPSIPAPPQASTLNPANRIPARNDPGR